MCDVQQPPNEAISATKKVSDQWRWRCNSCKKERSVRTDAFFKDAKVSIPNWLRFITEWSRHPHATIQQLRASTIAYSAPTHSQKYRVIQNFASPSRAEMGQAPVKLTISPSNTFNLK